VHIVAFPCRSGGTVRGTSIAGGHGAVHVNAVTFATAAPR
jgi:hypothetical protein